MKKLVSFLCLLAVSFSVLKAGEGFVYLADQSKLFLVKDNEIYSPDGNQLLYFSKGNIFFRGSSDDRQSIYLLSSSMNASSKSLQIFYLNDKREDVFSFRNNQFYNGKNETEDFQERNKLIHLQKSGKWLSFYSSVTDSLLAYFNADSLPASTAILVAHFLIQNYRLVEKLSQLVPLITTTQEQFSTIRPIWGNITDNEWLWDGKVLRMRWSNDPRFFWTFDGQFVKPLYGNNVNLQYEWDGEYFKPVWRTSRAEEWSYDGRLIKPIYSTDWATQYVLESGVLKPWSNVHAEKEWQVEGEIPVPILILVVSGIARAH